MPPSAEGAAPTDNEEGPEAIPQALLLRILLDAQSIDSVIVGGQALNIWGEVYYHRASSELAAYRPFESKDIDFLGGKEEAAALANSLSAKVYIPGRGDQTPSSALVRIPFDDKVYLVDFLYEIAGVSAKSVRDAAYQLTINPTGDAPMKVRVLHPLHVLKSRVAGIITLHRTDTFALRQLHAAPIVAREHIAACLEEGRIDEAQRTIQEMINLATNPINTPIYRDHGVDLLGHAAALADRTEWDPRFAQYNITNACEAGRKRLARRAAEADRQRRRAPS